MSAYRTALFFHLLGVITLFAGVVLQQRGAAGLRGATTTGGIRFWMRVLRPSALAFPVALAVLLASGLYMATQAWSLATPWIATGFWTLLFMGVVGGTVVRRQFVAIEKASAAAPAAWSGS
jgi:hypothetical protein